jgi:ferric-dicitrate binding protein FerR (iron transport regulator)
MRKQPNKWNDLARYLAGEMDMKEELSYRSRMEGNQEDLTELKTMEQTWKQTQPGSPGPERNSSEAWQRLQRRLAEDGLLDQPAEATGEKRPMTLLRMAAVILLAIAIGGPFLYFGLVRNPAGIPLKDHFAERGTSTVDLPDGSRVYLNEGAKISYPSDFEHNRSVMLRGEAFFEVMSDPVNPFTVQSGKITVSVLGTSFNVKDSEKTAGVEVFVTSGKVRMSVENSGEFITLQSGEMGLSEAHTLIRTLSNDPNYLSWKTKEFIFVDAALPGVIGKLEQCYHVNIRADGVDLDSLRLTSTYREQSIDAILETIATAFGMAVHKEKDTYFLTTRF